MADKTPMEHMFDFFSELFGLLFEAGAAGIKGFREARKKRNKLKNTNVGTKDKPQMVPKMIADEMGVEDMPIARKEWNKLSTSQQRAYKAQWGNFTPQQKRQARDIFEEQQGEIIKDAAKEYCKLMNTSVVNYDVYDKASMEKIKKEYEKMAPSSKQKEEIQNSKHDANKEVQNEIKQENPQNQKEDVHVVNQNVKEDVNKNDEPVANQTFTAQRNGADLQNREINNTINQYSNLQIQNQNLVQERVQNNKGYDNLSIDKPIRENYKQEISKEQREAGAKKHKEKIKEQKMQALKDNSISTSGRSKDDYGSKTKSNLSL